MRDLLYNLDGQYLTEILCVQHAILMAFYS